MSGGGPPPEEGNGACSSEGDPSANLGRRKERPASYTSGRGQEGVGEQLEERGGTGDRCS